MTRNVIACKSEIVSNSPFRFSVKPNPFSKSATISYTMPVAGKVSIKLYNATGRLVGTLVDDYCDVGSYSLKIQNSEFRISSGIYFLDLDCDQDQKISKKIKIIILP
ncbi:MAG: T9SS type A sorting domain-containing protein [Patescibacteria group bacterium]|nr:T9SS type A sorting domain-containing protein [Patescibacteria group bacterium]